MLDSFKETLEDFHNGKMIILIDEEDRENEGDLVIAAEKITPEAINFMVTYGRGLICVPMTKPMLDRLDLKQMVVENTESHHTAFTISVDAKNGVTTGISAADRAKTIKVLIDDKTKPEDLRRPGHMFPLMAKEGGVFIRQGQTEGSVDLAMLAGYKPAAVICEIMNDDGTMSRLPELRKFAEKHELKIISVDQIRKFRRIYEKHVTRLAEAFLPTDYGEFKIIIFGNDFDNHEHVALVYGDVAKTDNLLVRLHSECLTGDTFTSHRCDCRAQLHTAMQKVAEEGKGIILYMRQEGRGIGLANKIKAYHLQEKGFDTVDANVELGFPADMREYSLAAQMLRDLKVNGIRLLTNNPDKINDLEEYGITVKKREPLVIPSSDENRFYLETKKNKMKHIFPEKV